MNANIEHLTLALEQAVRRIEIERAEGGSILAAWLPGARRALAGGKAVVRRRRAFRARMGRMEDGALQYVIDDSSAALEAFSGRANGNLYRYVDERDLAAAELERRAVVRARRKRLRDLCPDPLEGETRSARRVMAAYQRQEWLWPRDKSDLRTAQHAIGWGRLQARKWGTA